MSKKKDTRDSGFGGDDKDPEPKQRDPPISEESGGDSDDSNNPGFVPQQQPAQQPAGQPQQQQPVGQPQPQPPVQPILLQPIPPLPAPGRTSA